MPDPVVVQVMREFKEALRLREQAQMTQMAARYLEIERTLGTQMELLATDMAARKAAGQAVSEAALYRMERYKALQAQARAEYDKYIGQYALPLIETEQRYYGEIGVTGAWDALAAQAGAGGINIAWNRLPAEAIENMVGLAGDGSPLKALLAKGYPDAMDGMIKQLITSTALGINPRETARRMASGFGLGLDRVLTISRTEQLRVFRMASTAQYRESGIVKGFKRIATKDTRTCLACLFSDGEVFETEDELSDHPNGRCLVPETLVAGPPIGAFISRYYRGDVLTISLASGQNLTVTPNHPILTERGWVEARSALKGENVVCGFFSQGAASSMGPDKYQVPTLIENIPRALGMNRLISVPTAAQDFHGDGVGSDIHIVWANGLLWNSGDTSNGKPAAHKALGLGYAKLPFLSGLGNLATVLEGLMRSAHYILSDLDAAMMLLYRSLLGQQLVGLGWASAGNPVIFEYSGDYIARYAKSSGEGVFGIPCHISADDCPNTGQVVKRHSTFGHSFIDGNTPILSQRAEQPASLEYIRESLFRDVELAGGSLATIAGNVSLDCILDVGIRRFSGHVYNLQTSTGWYNASSSIAPNGRCANMPIVHNCAVIPILSVGPAVQWETGQEWFKGLDPETQERMLGTPVYDAWRGHRIGLGDLRKTAHSDVWGDSPRVATHAELGIA